MNSKKVTEFADIISNQDLLTYLQSVSITVPTPVQAVAIPKLLGAGHFTVKSHTGTGKTLCYLLPLVSQLKASENKSDAQINGAPRALIVAPTRELASQIFSVLKEISHFAKLRVRKLVGGDKGKSLKSMFSMPIDVLVTTPDRCLRSLQNKELSKAKLQFVVLDEADHLLEPSFKNIIQQMAGELTATDFQLFLISATRPAQFNDTIKSFFPTISAQAISGEQDSPKEDRFEIFNIYVEEKDKIAGAKDFLRLQKYRNGVIFAGSKGRAQKLAEELLAAGQKRLFVLHKDLEIKERVEVIDGFREKGGVLIATDIFARGIDVPHLEWVLNFDIPSEPFYYLHRSGRVGRVGRDGDVYNFITSRDGDRVERINKALTTQGRNDLKIEIATPKPKSSSKPSASAKPRFGAKSTTSAKPSAGSKPSAGAKPKFGTKPATGSKPASGSKPSSGFKPKSGPGQRFNPKRK